MIQVANLKTGQKETIEDAGLPQLLDSGEYGLIKGQELEFETPEGERRIVPAEQAYEAIGANFKYIPKKQVEQERLVEESAGEPLSAIGAAGLRGLTLGLSDQILAATGITTPEKLSALKEGNPILSPIAEVGGALAPAVFSGGTSAGARALAFSPAGIVEGLSVAAAKKAAPLAGKILSTTSSNLTKQIVESAVKTGAGSAVEGALFGLGTAISEDALGDAEFNAETAMAAMGRNALIGGVFGSAAGGLTAMAGQGAKAVVNQYNSLRKKALDTIEDVEIKQNIANKITTDEAVDSYLKANNVDADDLAERMELSKAAERLGVPLTPGMKEGGLFRELEGSLAKSKSLFGDLTRKEVDSTYSALEEVKNIALKDAAPIDPVTIGTKAKEGISAKISEELEPAKLLYQDLKPILETTPITQSLKKRFITENKKTFQERVAGGGTWLDKINALETIDDVTKLRSLVGAEKRTFGLKPTEKEYLNKIYDQLTTLRKNAINTNLKGKPFVKKTEFIKDVADAQKLADEIYATTHTKYDFLKKHLGIKSSSMDELMDKLDEIPEKVISEKILNLRDPKTAEQFQTYFPEIYDLARARRLQAIAETATDKGMFSPAKFYNSVKKLDESDLKILFPHIKNPKDMLVDYKKVVDSLPPLTNPSGTAYEQALQGMFSLPYQAQEALRYFVYKSGPDGMVNRLVNAIPITGSIEKAANIGKVQISDAVESFFKKSSAMGTKAVNRIITGQDISDKDLEDTESKIKLYQTNPDEIVNNFVNNNKQMLNAAPKTAEALQSRVMAATQFLSSKVPKVSPTPFDDATISRSELLKFKNYSDAVENPYRVLETIKSGYVAPEYMEAFSAVYPKMAAAIKEEFAERLSEFKNLNEKQKASLSVILGMDTRKAFTPRGFSTLQGVAGQGVQRDLAGQAPRKVPVTGAKNLNQSQRSASSIDRVLNRQ